MFCSKHSEGDNRLVVFNVPIELFTARLTNPKHKTPIETIFVVDVSGSMDYFIDKRNQKIALVKNGIEQFINYVAPFSEFKNIYVTIITFNTSATTIVKSTKLTVSDNKELINRMRSLEPTGETDIYAALKHTNTHINEVNAMGIDNVSVFFLTDGYHSDKTTRSEMIETFALSAHRKLYHGMGLGNVTMYDSELLTSLFQSRISCAPTGEDVNTGIIDVAFSEFTSMYKNVVFTPNDALLQRYTISTTLDNRDGCFTLGSFDVSKRVPFFLTKKAEETGVFASLDDAGFTMTCDSDGVPMTLFLSVADNASIVPLEGEFTQRYFKSVADYKQLLSVGETITPTEMNIQMRTLLTVLTLPPVPEAHPIADYNSDLVKQIELFTQNAQLETMNTVEFSSLCRLGLAQADRQISGMALRSVTHKLSRGVSETVYSILPECPDASLNTLASPATPVHPITSTTFVPDFPPRPPTYGSLKRVTALGDPLELEEYVLHHSLLPTVVVPPPVPADVVPDFPLHPPTYGSLNRETAMGAPLELEEYVLHRSSLPTAVVPPPVPADDVPAQVLPTTPDRPNDTACSIC